MREKTGKRGCLAYIIAVLLSQYLAAFFLRLYVPDRQLFLDTDSLKEQKVMAFVYDEAPVELLPAGEEMYAGVIRSGGSELQVSVRLRDAVPERCTVAGEEKAFIPVSRYITSDDYLGTYCVQLKQQTAQRFRLGAILSLQAYWRSLGWRCGRTEERAELGRCSLIPTRRFEQSG